MTWVDWVRILGELRSYVLIKWLCKVYTKTFCPLDADSSSTICNVHVIRPVSWRIDNLHCTNFQKKCYADWHTCVSHVNCMRFIRLYTRLYNCIQAFAVCFNDNKWNFPITQSKTRSSYSKHSVSKITVWKLVFLTWSCMIIFMFACLYHEFQALYLNQSLLGLKAVYCLSF